MLRFEKIGPKDYLLLNLMLTDLIMILPNFPMAVYNSFHGEWMFNQKGLTIKHKYQSFNSDIIQVAIFMDYVVHCLDMLTYSHWYSLVWKDVWQL